MRANSPENITMSWPVVISWSRMNLMDTSVAPEARALRRSFCISCHSPFDSRAHRVPSAFALQLGMGSAGVGGYNESSPGSPGGVPFPFPPMATLTMRLSNYAGNPAGSFFIWRRAVCAAGTRRDEIRRLEKNGINKSTHDATTHYELVFFPMIVGVGALE